MSVSTRGGKPQKRKWPSTKCRGGDTTEYQNGQPSGPWLFRSGDQYIWWKIV